MQCPSAVRSVSSWFVAGATLVLLGVAGCAINLYEVDMSVDGPRIRRSLTASMNGSDNEIHSISPEEQARLADAYGTQPTSDKRGRTILAGEFLDKLPDDVGGHGEMTRWETSLGSLSVYLERFRGDDDLQGQFTRRLERVDLAVDLLQAWVDSAADDSDNGRRLREFVDDEFRRDAKNLSLLLWAVQSTIDPTAGAMQEELLARLTQYGIEHDYIDMSELPAWSHASSGDLGQVRRLLAQKLGIDDVTAVLPPLKSEAALRQSFDEQFRNSDAYRIFRQQHHLDADIDQLPSDVLSETFFTAFYGWGQSHDSLVVRLRLPSQPFATNGQWEAEGLVKWTADMARRDAIPLSLLPTLLYAAWSEPDIDEQQARFGRLLLTDEALGDYVLWRRSLSDKSAGDWEDFLTGLNPDEDLKKQLVRYRESTPDEACFNGCAILETALDEE